MSIYNEFVKYYVQCFKTLYITFHKFIIHGKERKKNPRRKNGTKQNYSTCRLRLDHRLVTVFRTRRQKSVRKSLRGSWCTKLNWGGLGLGMGTKKNDENCMCSWWKDREIIKNDSCKKHPSFHTRSRRIALFEDVTNVNQHQLIGVHADSLPAILFDCCF